MLDVLIEKYQRNRDSYLHSDYNETQLRNDFLNPFFQLLGWDITNAAGKPTNEREVLLEESVREDALSTSKKPDYTFRLYAERKFFLEAKKPSIVLETNDVAARQVRRYGFTARLKISVLSNFEHLIIYDCSEPVQDNDVSSKCRIRVYHYSEYEAKFEEIGELLGKDSVFSGRFDEHWRDIEARQREISVDSLFLSQINEWRITLAQQILAHRSDLSELALNDLVQRYLNSIIFLRVCEDRNLEEYRTLFRCASNQDYNALIEKFRLADRKYNAGLFSHEMVGEIIRANHSAFWIIINKLYYPESPYSFSVFSSDILGGIYEIFLTQRLRIVDGIVSLVPKPENADRDIVTTPIHIVRDILRLTVKSFCEGKSDEQIIAGKFADIACGSGAFLLETFQLLTDSLVDYYLRAEITKLRRTGVNTYLLPFDLKRQILENCIFGVDKDFNAVEATKFGLLLKLLEDEDNATIITPALPSLNDNIHFGNSLVEPRVTSQSNRREINPFDFGERKFDCIVGNPPYMSTEDMRRFTPAEISIYASVFSSAHKQYDKYFLFVERALTLLRPGGYLGYIVPIKFTKVGAGLKLRNLLQRQRSVSHIISFGANQIFADKTTYTCILIARKHDLQTFQYLEIGNLTQWKIRHSEPPPQYVGIDELSEEAWVLVPRNLKPAYDQILQLSITLGDLVGEENVYNGIQTSANPIYINVETSHDDEFIYFKKNGISWKVEKLLTRPYFKTSSGSDNLNTYRPFRPNAFVIFPYLVQDGRVTFVDITTLQDKFPFTYAYLNHFKTELQRPTRDIKPEPQTPHEWYRYGRQQSLDSCNVPAKIIVGVLAQGNKYAIDFNQTLISSGGTAGYCMITLPNNLQYSIYYIQALLNSKYLEWFAALNGEVFRGGYIARGTKVLKRLPIIEIDFADQADRALHDEIADIQRSLIDIQGQIDDSAGNDRGLQPLKRQFQEQKSQLDLLLRQLFNLGELDSSIPLIADLYATN